jgi:hypothetical protein
VTGVWEIWGNWSACSITCGEGVKTRQRTCMSGDVRECEGNDTDTSTCSDALNCPSTHLSLPYALVQYLLVLQKLKSRL